MKETQRRFVAVHQEFYDLTGDFYHAMVLGQMNFYQTITQGVDEFIEQENERAKARDGVFVDPTGGWFYKSAEQLCEELMHPFKRTKAAEILKNLVEDGWLMVRDNPKEKWDKVKQYRLDLARIFEALHSMGHSLPKWDMGSHYPKLQAMRKAVADRGPSVSVSRRSITAPRQSCTATREALPTGTTTGTATAENLYPLQAKDFFSSSFPAPHPQTNQQGAALASPAAGPAKWPESRDPEMPKANGYPDWCAAVRKYDEASASEFSKLFNQPGPLEDPRLARKYWKARRGGLTEEVLRKIVAYHDDLAIPGLDWSWKARDFHGVLDQKYRSKILPLLAEVRSEKVGELKAELDLMNDPIGLQQVLRTVASLPPPKPEDMPAVLQAGAYSRTAWFVVMHNRGGYPLLELQQTFREQLKADLAFNQAWVQFFTHQKLDPVDVVGLTFPEIVALQQAATAEIHAKLKALP